MIAATTFVLLTLGAQFGDEPAMRAPREPVLECDAPGETRDLVHLDGVADVPIATVGSRWWVPRFSEDGVLTVFTSTPSLGLEHEATGELVSADYRESAAAIGLAVPPDASPGDRYLLHADIGVVATLTVAVGETTLSDGAISGASVVAGDAQRCEARCAEPGLTAPATPQLRFTHTGGPLILDVFAVQEGSVQPLLTDVHRVDSYWLDDADQPTEVEIDLDALGFDSPLDVYVYASDPHDLRQVHDEFIPLGPLDRVPVDTDGLPECEDGNPPSPAFGCPFFGGSFIAFLFVPALAVRLRRRRR